MSSVTNILGPKLLLVLLILLLLLWLLSNKMFVGLILCVYLCVYVCLEDGSYVLCRDVYADQFKSNKQISARQRAGPIHF